MNATQSRMARAALQISVRDLARMAKVSTDTIVRLERGEELKERTVDAIRETLESSRLIAMSGDQILLLVDQKELGPRSAEWKARFESGPPVGPATDAVAMMEAAIEDHRSKRKR